MQCKAVQKCTLIGKLKINSPPLMFKVDEDKDTSTPDKDYSAHPGEKGKYL